MRPLPWRPPAWRQASASRQRPASASQPQPHRWQHLRRPTSWHGRPPEYRRRSGGRLLQPSPRPAWARVWPWEWPQLQPSARTPPAIRFRGQAERHRRRLWPARPRGSPPPTFSSCQPSNSLGKGLCQMRRMGRLQTAKTADRNRTNSHKKLVSAAIGRVRDFFHKLHLKLYRCLHCCQRRMRRLFGNPVQNRSVYSRGSLRKPAGRHYAA